MTNALQPSNIFNGTDGAVWITTDEQVLKIGSMKTFTLKQKNLFYYL